MKCVPIDYMHCILEGVTKWLVNKRFTSTYYHKKHGLILMPINSPLARYSIVNPTTRLEYILLLFCMLRFSLLCHNYAIMLSLCPKLCWQNMLKPITHLAHLLNQQATNHLQAWCHSSHILHCPPVPQRDEVL